MEAERNLAEGNKIAETGSDVRQRQDQETLIKPPIKDSAELRS
jgi:hypothetical protein